MTRHLYIIRDRVAEYSGPIFQARNDQDAIRQFFTALGQKGTTLNEHPADFELIEVGTQDENTGAVLPSYTKVTNGTVWSEVTSEKLHPTPQVH